MTNGPVLIDLEGAPQVPVTEALPVPDPDAPPPEGRAMQAAIQVATRRPSRLGRWFWSALLLLLGAVVSVAAWDFVTGLLERAPLLGWAVAGLVALLLLLMLVMALREFAGFARLRRIDRLRQRADAAAQGGTLAAAQAVVGQVTGLYQAREDTSWGRSRVAEQRAEIVDGDALLALAEREIIAPLDAAAKREIEAAARQVAAVTALVPLALADVVAALTANARMIRRIAEIYGGRTGTLGNWRLVRAVLTHLVATGAVAAGDDLIGTMAGGGVLAKLSRRFGEGMVNGALTARVGIAAMDVCRPMPFVAQKRPSVARLVQRSLTGLFDKD